MVPWNLRLFGANLTQHYFIINSYHISVNYSDAVTASTISRPVRSNRVTGNGQGIDS